MGLQIRRDLPALFQARLHRPHALEDNRVLASQLGEPSKGVKQFQLHCRFEQGLLVVLSVDVDEKPAEGLHRAKSHGPAIHM